MPRTAAAATRGTTSDIEELVARARRAFDALPTMRLTRPQFGRLLQVDRTTIERVIERLVENHYLVDDADGRLGRWPHLFDLDAEFERNGR
jgi:hypothetical protein